MERIVLILKKNIFAKITQYMEDEAQQKYMLGILTGGKINMKQLQDK